MGSMEYSIETETAKTIEALRESIVNGAPHAVELLGGVGRAELAGSVSNVFMSMLFLVGLLLLRGVLVRYFFRVGKGTEDVSESDVAEFILIINFVVFVLAALVLFFWTSYSVSDSVRAMVAPEAVGLEKIVRILR